MEGKTPHEQWLAAADGGRRATLISGAASLSAFFATHDADTPDLCVLSYRMRGGETERHARVDEVAAMLGVHARTLADGTYSVSRDFGPFRVEAHTTPHAARMATVRRIFGHHYPRRAA
jgi:hypothetical protein